MSIPPYRPIELGPVPACIACDGGCDACTEVIVSASYDDARLYRVDVKAGPPDPSSKAEGDLKKPCRTGYGSGKGYACADPITEAREMARVLLVALQLGRIAKRKLAAIPEPDRYEDLARVDEIGRDLREHTAALHRRWPPG